MCTASLHGRPWEVLESYVSLTRVTDALPESTWAVLLLSLLCTDTDLACRAYMLALHSFVQQVSMQVPLCNKLCTK